MAKVIDKGIIVQPETDPEEARQFQLTSNNYAEVFINGVRYVRIPDNEAPANANEISNNLAEAQKTNEDWTVELAEEGTPLAIFQKERTDAINEMFDNEGEFGIYPTSKFFARLDKCVSDLLTLKDEAHRKEMEEAVTKALDEFSGFAHNKYYKGTDGKEYAYSTEIVYMIEPFLNCRPTKEVTEELPTNH